MAAMHSLEGSLVKCRIYTRMFKNGWDMKGCKGCCPSNVIVSLYENCQSGTREINSGGSTSWTKKCSRNAVVLGIGGFWRQRDTVLFNTGSIVPISKLAKDFPKGMLPRRVMLWSEAVDLILPHDFYEDYFHCLKRRRKTHALKPNKNNTKLGTKIEILCWLRVGFGLVGSPFPLPYGRGYREIPTSRWLTR